MHRPSITRRVLSGCVAACLGAVAVPVSVARAAPVDDPTAVPSRGEGGPSAAILPISVQGELPEADRQALTEQLVAGLQRGDFAIVAPDRVLEASADASECATAECYKSVARALDATHLVRARVEVIDRDYEVEVTLLDGATGKTVASTRESCEICGVTDAATMLSTAAATLKTKLDALAQGPSTLGVTSTPPGAEVLIDGELVGTTPFEGPVIPGKHVLRISKDGYITLEREVMFVEAVAESLEFSLEKVPSRLPSRPYGYAAIGLGIAGLGVATAFAFLDDRELRVGGDCVDAEDAMGRCETLWNTQFIVLGTAIAGAALTTLGVAILLSSKGRGKASKSKATAKLQRRQRPQIGVGFGSAVVRGRF